MTEEAPKKGDKKTDVYVGRQGTTPIVIVWGAIICFIGIIVWIVWKFFFAPSLLLSVSAYPMPTSLDESPSDSSSRPNLSVYVTGKVLVKGKPVDDGTVKLTAERTDQQGSRSSETILVTLNKGEFVTDNPLSMKPDERIRISGEAWSPGFVGSATDEVFYGYGTTPVISPVLGYSILFGFWLLLIVLFLWAFTGPQTKQKNRIAIIVSYFIIWIFLDHRGNRAKV